MNTTKVNEPTTRLDKVVAIKEHIGTSTCLVPPNEKNHIQKVHSHSNRANRHQISNPKARDLVGNE